MATYKSALGLTTRGKASYQISGFGTGQDEYSRFTYDSSTGALFFDLTQTVSDKFAEQRSPLFKKKP